MRQKIVYQAFSSVVTCAVAVFVAGGVQAQPAVSKMDTPLRADAAMMLRIFIDCPQGDCDFDYIRNTIKFVNFVREPYQSQVHVLISEEKTASDGRRFSLRFLGREKFQGMDLNLFYISPVNDPEDRLRHGLTQVLKMGLMPFISQMRMAHLLDIAYNESDFDSARRENIESWNYWVFHIDLQGQWQAEESQNEWETAASFKAERITENWKISSEWNYENLQKHFKDNGEQISGERREWEAEAKMIKSLNSHWSAGLFAQYHFSTYRNLNFSLGLAPGIEYNFFPWQQSDRHIFSLSYSAGARSLRYEEMTIFNKLKETLSYGRMRIELDLIQPWGEVDASLENAHYFHDLAKNSTRLETDLSFRISRGLSVKMEMQAESVHDQLYLAKGDATREEILLKQKKLATTYEISVLFGFRYSFGSIYNNIVNRRF